MNVCIVDDDWVCRFITQKMIEKTAADSQISQFVNGQEALDFIINSGRDFCELPELIFLDINMPLVNGWQFLDKLQNTPLSTYQPRIYISSSSQDPDDLARAGTYPAVHGYLVKPISKSALQQVFNNLNVVLN